MHFFLSSGQWVPRLPPGEDHGGWLVFDFVDADLAVAVPVHGFEPLCKSIGLPRFFPGDDIVAVPIETLEPDFRSDCVTKFTARFIDDSFELIPCEPIIVIIVDYPEYPEIFDLNSPYEILPSLFMSKRNRDSGARRT